MKSGPLTIENPDLALLKQVPLTAQHIPCWLIAIVDKLSRLGQTIQKEWSLLPDVFQLICTWWHQPPVDVFTPQPIRAVGVLFSPMLSGWAGWRAAGRSLSGLYLRNHKV